MFQEECPCEKKKTFKEFFDNFKTSATTTPPSTDKKKEEDVFVSFDLLFSFWIVAWFIIYFCVNKNTSKISVFIKKHFNPKLALYLALYSNLFTFFAILIYNPQFIIFIKFTFLIFAIKILPLYLLKNTKIKWVNDTIALIFVFFVYLFYLKINNQNIYDVYINATNSIIQNDNKTPIFHLLNSAKLYFHSSPSTSPSTPSS